MLPAALQLVSLPAQGSGAFKQSSVKPEACSVASGRSIHCKEMHKGAFRRGLRRIASFVSVVWLCVAHAACVPSDLVWRHAHMQDCLHRFLLS